MTKIQWTDRTWNPVTGCTRVSEGCRNCYAERLTATRLKHLLKYCGLAVMQPSGPKWTNKVRTHPDVLRHPLSWRKPAKVFVCDMSDLFHEAVPFEFVDQVFAVMALCPHLTFQVLTKRPERMAEYFALMDDEVTRTGQLSSAAGAFLDGPWIHAEGKRYRRRIEQFINDLYAGEAHELGDREPTEVPWPLPNVWLGTSIEDQKTADARIPHLLRCPAAVRFLSCEPLLAPINLPTPLGPASRVHVCLDIAGAIRNRSFDGFTDADGHKLSPDKVEAGLKQYLSQGRKLLPMDNCDNFDPNEGCRGHRLPGINWVIVGGESGPAAKHTDIADIRGIVQQCQAAGVACFVKQLGAVPYDESRMPHEGTITTEEMQIPEHRETFARMVGENIEAAFVKLRDPKGGDPDEWPEDLRIRDFPTPAEGGAACTQ